MSFVGMLAATLLSCLIVCEQKASTKDMGKRKTDEEFKKELKEKFPQIKPKGVYINGTKKYHLNVWLMVLNGTVHLIMH